jgi:hypothetical protein
VNVQRALASCALLLLTWAAATPGAAQVVKGRVVLAGTDRGIADVAVYLQTAAGQRVASATTDTAGAFIVSAPRLGMCSLHAEHIGLASVESAPFQVNVSQVVEVLLRMDVTAVPLEPLTVTARSDLDIGFLAGYYERVARHERMGFGHVFTRDRIQERQPLDIADLLRDVPSVTVVDAADRLPSIVFRNSRGECIPKVYINGIRQNRGNTPPSPAVVDESVRPVDLEGVEVYRGISEMPAEYYDEGHCGVILLWTRRDADGGRPFTVRRILLGLAGAGIMLLLMAK